MWARAAAFCLGATCALAACVQSPSPSDRQISPKPQRTLLLGATALHPMPGNLEISFGRYRPGVLPLLAQILNEPPAPGITCPQNPRIDIASFPKAGLTVAFKDAHLIAWRVVKPGLATLGGVQVGQPRANAPSSAITYHGTEPSITAMSSAPDWTATQLCPE